MAKAPYTPSPKNVTEFFNRIQTVGKPDKVAAAWLPTIGFKSSNDRYLVALCKTLGFIDSAGTPTARWLDFKDKQKAPKVMAEAIKTAYADLYKTYPDAEKRDDQALRNYFASKSGAAESVANLMVQTFKNLSGFADFGEQPREPRAPAPDKAAGGTTVNPVTVNINIQLQLPATQDAAIYDSLFGALRKYFP